MLINTTQIKQIELEGFIGENKSEIDVKTAKVKSISFFGSEEFFKER